MMNHDVFRNASESLPAFGQAHAALASALDQGYGVAEVLLDPAGEPRDYRFVYVNSLFATFTGISAKDALGGKTVRKSIPGLEGDWIQTCGRVALTGEPVRFEAGSKEMGRRFDVRAFRLGGSDVRYVGILLADVTEQTQSRRAQIRSEARYRALATASSDVAYGMSADWSVMLPLDGRGLVASNEEPIRGWLDKNIPAEEHARIHEAIAKAVASKSLFELEHRVQRPDGSVGWTRSRAVPILDDAGNIVEWFGAASDVTDQKRAESSLRESEAALRRANEELESRVEERTRELVEKNLELEGFTYSVSHDLRAPLRAIVSKAHLTLEEEGPNVSPDGRLNLQRLAAAARKVAQLVDDLLQYARLGTRELRRETVDLAELAKATATDVAYERHGCEISFRADHDATAECDPRLVGMALHNLLDNACKYSRPGERARVEFACEKREREQVFCVRDDGIGFDMAYVQKLFMPFERLHREEYAGTGIGLANVKRAIERHGGRVWAESDGPGRGSRFYFTLA